jgi:uncharacterized protein YndB with AHSA1/START domain
MRLVTYGTMDGLALAVLITEVEPIDSIDLIHPQAITDRRFNVQEGDILANVPYHESCAKWFDHHEATRTYSEPPAEFEGRYGLARSCARLVYDYYLPDNPQIRRFEELIYETDRFASADLSIEEVLDPERYILIGFTVDPRSGLSGQRDYFRKMVEWMRGHSVDDVLELNEVKQRTEEFLQAREAFLDVMGTHSRLVGNVIFTDLRDVEKIPAGDRFSIYTLFPEANVSLRVERGAMSGLVVARAGHSIFNRTCPVHLGSLMAQYGGGGQKGTAATPLSPEYADKAISEILEELQKDQRSAKTRSVETGIEIKASIEDVWDALTDPEELIHWFPLDAEVEPGEGGAMKWSWGEDFDWRHRIEVWEPPHHLMTSYDADPKVGQAVPGVDPSSQESDEKVRLTVDFHLERRAGKTALRLAHSGFLTSADWDDEYDGVRLGWAFELFGLREYMENHLGKPRSVVWARALTDLPTDTIWERLTSENGLVAEGALSLLESGDPYFFKTVHGDVFRGVTRASNPPKEFYGTVENLGHAVMRVHIFGFQGRRDIHVWLSAYDLPRTEVDTLRTHWKDMLEELFPEAEIK